MKYVVNILLLTWSLLYMQEDDLFLMPGSFQQVRWPVHWESEEDDLSWFWSTCRNQITSALEGHMQKQTSKYRTALFGTNIVGWMFLSFAVTSFHKMGACHPPSPHLVNLIRAWREESNVLCQVSAGMQSMGTAGAHSFLLPLSLAPLRQQSDS